MGADTAGYDHLTAMFIVARFEDEFSMRVGTVAELAKILETKALGAYDIEVISLQVLTAAGQPVPVDYQVTGGGSYNEDDWAHPKVSVRLPDGRTEVAFYRVDGRA